MFEANNYTENSMRNANLCIEDIIFCFRLKIKTYWSIYYQTSDVLTSVKEFCPLNITGKKTQFFHVFKAIKFYLTNAL